jgi:hypothetical protein
MIPKPTITTQGCAILRALCLQFKKGLVESGVQLSEEHLQAVFRHFDADCTGQLSFDEFSAGVRPPMSQRRKNLVLMVCTLTPFVYMMRHTHSAQRHGDMTDLPWCIVVLYSFKSAR